MIKNVTKKILNTEPMSEKVHEIRGNGNKKKTLTEQIEILSHGAEGQEEIKKNKLD